MAPQEPAGYACKSSRCLRMLCETAAALPMRHGRRRPLGAASVLCRFVCRALLASLSTPQRQVTPPAWQTRRQRLPRTAMPSGASAPLRWGHQPVHQPLQGLLQLTLYYERPVNETVKDTER